MKSFYFDFMARPVAHSWVGRIGLLCGLSVLGMAIAYDQLELQPRLRASQSLVQIENDKLRRQTPVPTLKPADLAQSWDRAQQVAVQLGLSWPHFFASLGETTRQGNVAFISIEPDPLKGTVVLMAEARDMGAMLEFVTRLQDSAEFSDVVLQSHVVNTSVPEHPVRFRVAAAWRTTQ